MRPSPQPRDLSDAAVLAEAAALFETTGGERNLHVTGISLDSRRIEPGDLYAALPGANFHGAVFIDQAVANGAVAVLTDPAGTQVAGDLGVPFVVVPEPRAILGELSAWVYGYPARGLTTIGITGTNGKTTTSILAECALRACGKRTGLIGTVANRIQAEEVPAIRTTPEAPDLHALLAVMLERGVDTLVMEVSSHALALGRVDGVQFDLAVFTNLSEDHLDFHRDLEDYFQAKASLFTPGRAKRGLVCADDEWGRRLLADPRIELQSYGVLGDADWRAEDLHQAGVGTEFELTGPGFLCRASVGVPGVFNVENTVAAVAASAVATGVDACTAAAGISACPGVPGRMEPIDEGQQFTVIVDYAHTPEAVDEALAVGRGLTDASGGTLWVVIGAGGDREHQKRPLMGSVAARQADYVIVTDDNPRSEDPAEIRQQILSGAAEAGVAGAVREIADRTTALGTAVQDARAGDVVMVLGRGHESKQEVAGQMLPLDDRSVIRDALRDLLRGAE